MTHYSFRYKYCALEEDGYICRVILYARLRDQFVQTIVVVCTIWEAYPTGIVGILCACFVFSSIWS